MKIAIFYSGYLPGEKYGGPVRSISNFVELIGTNNDIYIICSNHDLHSTEPYNNITKGWNNIGKAKVLYLPDKLMNRYSFKKIIDTVEPDIIYVSSLFSAKISIPILLLSKIHNKRVLLAPRGELNSTALNSKTIKKKTYLMLLKISGLLNNVYLQATSKEEMKNIVSNLKIKEDNVFLLPNIPTLYCHKTKINKEPDHTKICFVGRILPNKNLLYAIEVIQKSTAYVSFDIYGNVEDDIYWKQCESKISESPSNVIIRYMGNKTASEIEKIYSEYDLLISPTLFENYGQAIAEAMLHDTPVLISKGTTPWDAINDYQAGYSISLDEPTKFVDIINIVASMDNKEYTKLIDRLNVYCSVTFDFDMLTKEYTNAFDKILELEG